VLQHCVSRSYSIAHVFEEVGSGMTDTRVKMLRLFDLAVKGEIGRVVIEHKDRLARFNFNIFQRFFESHGVTVEWLEDVLPKSYEAELVEDMVSLMSSFSAKVYGRRSAENRKKKKAEAA
jgi:predicted site-specific integrase-resolvase